MSFEWVLKIHILNLKITLLSFGIFNRFSSHTKSKEMKHFIQRQKMAVKNVSFLFNTIATKVGIGLFSIGSVLKHIQTLEIAENFC